MNIYDILKELDIRYEEIEHKAIYTAEEALQENIANRIDGIGCKNLFVKSKNKYYLIFIKAEKRAELKLVAELLNETRLSFASEKELKNILNLTIGSVTPFGLVNDRENLVTLLIDKELENQKVLVHPNVNTKTVSIQLSDLIKLIEHIKHQYILF
ncbi:MAG: prolyl-tRNA synthetase associated domain-containing protein [Clostridia bacterium]|nr:prolyl-tRNA synthetase associated domain-containing protein [Clostridia bacterium]